MNVHPDSGVTGWRSSHRRASRLAGETLRLWDNSPASMLFFSVAWLISLKKGVKRRLTSLEERWSKPWAVSLATHLPPKTSGNAFYRFCLGLCVWERMPQTEPQTPSARKFADFNSLYEPQQMTCALLSASKSQVRWWVPAVTINVAFFFSFIFCYFFMISGFSL